MILRFILKLCWCLLHLLVGIMHTTLHLYEAILFYIISSGLLEKYQNLELYKLRYVALVIDSEEAKNTLQIKHLLQWLSSIGVKYVILYDIEGVLKRSLRTDQNNFTNVSIKSSYYKIQDADGKPANSRIHEGMMTIELLSFSDGKEGVAKAASFLCSNYLKVDSKSCNKIESIFTEMNMACALQAVGCSGPDPDLLLVCGPARCHLGFPAWRMRYTEIVHMGPLRYVKYGAVVKAIYDFTKKQQNYGT